MELMSRPKTVPDQEARIAFLRQPQAYPEKPARIETIETHMSWVFLTPRHAFKLKKPVRYDYLDFSTVAARKMNCEEELRLNQRLAPDVYLDVVPLVLDGDGGMRLGGQGEIIDWLVMMRRLPAERMLDYLIRKRALEPMDTHAVAEVLARFYRESPPIDIGGAEYRRQYEHKVRMNHDTLADPAYGLPADLVEAVHQAQRQFLMRAPELLEHRATDGRVIEGHGDLRPEHVCVESLPVIFDRLEFNRAFRIIDPADELAFLAMECERLDAPQVEPELLGAYRRFTGDYPPPQLVWFYKAHRACLRARLAIWHLRDLPRPSWDRWRTLAVDYLRLAAAHAARLEVLPA
jgi:aminoglycoside phosphotransferase family enzyme